MEDRFQQMIDDEQDSQNDDCGLVVSAGDDCPEDCTRTLFERHHPRNPVLNAYAHSDAPEVEVVCIHHGVVRSVQAARSL